jgi:probable rRNA maturation factor
MPSDAASRYEASASTSEATPWAEAVVLSPLWEEAGLDPAALVAAAVPAARAELDPPSDALAAIVFADDATLHQLNREHRGVDKPTNVLSFPAAAAPNALAEKANEPALLGDVVLGFETIAREASELGMTAANRTLHMIVHGYFHLHGCDHQAEDDAEEMESMERRSLARLGLADPYADPREGGGDV